MKLFNVFAFDERNLYQFDLPIRINRWMLLTYKVRYFYQLFDTFLKQVEILNQRTIELICSSQ